MAVIDKIYIDKFEDYLLFKEWCKKQPKIKDKYGCECSISDYIFKYNSFVKGKTYPIFNAPYYIDAYLIRNCPFDFIQNELKFNYGYKTQKCISDYELIKNEKLYATPYSQKNYIVGKHIKCIKHPSILYNTPFGNKFWWVDLDVPEELGYMWYNSNYNSWDFSDEFVINNLHSSVCVKYKTICAIKRAIRKWKLPIGTKVRCTGKYISETYIFEVIK